MIKYVIDVIRFMKKYPLSADGRFIVWLRNCLYLNWQKPWKWNLDIYWLWKQVERSRRMKERTLEGMLGFADGYNLCFKQFCEYLNKYDSAEAVQKMTIIKSFVDNVVLTEQTERSE